LKTAIITDWLTQMGGAERVVLAIKELFPDAPIYTTVYNPNTVDPVFHDMEIRTSFVQKLPGAKKSYTKYLPLMPTAVEQFDLTGYDLVISSSSSVAKGVLTRADTLHVCYCHTPMRYAWDFYTEYLQGPDVGTLKRKLIPWLMNYLRMWDRLSADRVDCFVANSRNVAGRIRKHYRREAEVIHPPVETTYFTPANETEDFFLVVSRLVPYKRVDLAIQACNQLQAPLRVIGTGPEMDRLKTLAGPTVKLLGRVSDAEIKWHYARCRAFLFPGEEDFGITPVEAQAAGRPVIAYGAGGARETVKKGITGAYFYAQTPEAMALAMRAFDPGHFNPQAIRRHAEGFDTRKFQQVFHEYVLKKFDEHSSLYLGRE
jgi:glycosyltransferase involved in cell wall biosynthesis